VLRSSKDQEAKDVTFTIKELMKDLLIVFPEERSRIQIIISALDVVDCNEVAIDLAKKIIPHKKQIVDRDVEYLIEILEMLGKEIPTEKWHRLKEDDKGVLWSYADTILELLIIFNKKSS
jgi:fatty-acid desaturase